MKTPLNKYPFGLRCLGSLLLEHFHNTCSGVLRIRWTAGLFGFWLRFGSVTGLFKPAPSPKPRQKPKIRAAHRYIFYVNALLISWTATAQPIIRTITGTGTKGIEGDGGPATSAQLNDPSGICRGPDGSLYICDTANGRIRQLKPDGTLITLVGAEAQPPPREPYEVRLDGAGNVFWVERLNHCVRRRDRATGAITMIAGTGAAGFSGDGGPADKAQLNEPHSIGFDKAGDLYICDVKNHRIRKVDMKTHLITTFSGTGERKPTPEGAAIDGAPLSGPRALAFDAEGNLWLALREGNAVLKLDLAKGIIHHVAGTGQKGFTGNGGPALEATMNVPKGIAVAPSGNVYLADTENHVIRMIDVKKNTIELVAGTGERGANEESDPLKCKLNRPHGIFVATDGTIFIGDTENHRVRMIH